MRRRGGRRVGGKWGEALKRALRRRPLAFPKRRAHASGEERLVPTSSRILFHLSRLTVAVSAANLLRWRAAASSGQGLGAEVRAAASTAAFSLRRALASGEERLVPTASRLILHLSRLKIAVPAANLVRWRALSSSGWGLGAEEGRDAVCWVPCGEGARERRGAACTDLLPADSSTFPVKGCSSGRESGSLRLKGGNG